MIFLKFFIRSEDFTKGCTAPAFKFSSSLEFERTLRRIQGYGLFVVFYSGFVILRSWFYILAIGHLHRSSFVLHRKPLDIPGLILFFMMLCYASINVAAFALRNVLCLLLKQDENILVECPCKNVFAKNVFSKTVLAKNVLTKSVLAKNALGECPFQK